MQNATRGHGTDRVLQFSYLNTRFKIPQMGEGEILRLMDAAGDFFFYYGSRQPFHNLVKKGCHGHFMRIK
jgi:hypothetical protein